jgi:hypothetical protein
MVTRDKALLEPEGVLRLYMPKLSLCSRMRAGVGITPASAVVLCQAIMVHSFRDMEGGSVARFFTAAPP